MDGRTYDEVARRRQRRGWRPVYVDSASRPRAKRDSIQMGAAALERTVGGAYEWRDGGLKRRRKLF